MRVDERLLKMPTPLKTCNYSIVVPLNYYPLCPKQVLIFDTISQFAGVSTHNGTIYCSVLGKN
jgi:hypothetical protein